MHPLLKQLGIDRLSPQERLDLISEIWDSLESKDLHPIHQSHKDELENRIAKMDANPARGSSWADVRARIEKR